jgi:radical SAM protein with 4Fe4S-binding SPASM domain
MFAYVQTGRNQVVLSRRENVIVEAAPKQLAPNHYMIDTRTVVFSYRDQYLLIAPGRRNWTKIAGEAYRLLVEGERQPIGDILARAKGEYGFEPQEVIGFLQELRARGNIYFDIEPEPGSEVTEANDVGAKVAFLNVTRRCNLKCPTCLAEASTFPVSDDAPLSVWQDIIDKLASAGVSTIVVTGGEPTIRRDLVDLLRYARERFEQIFMNTNGTLLTPDLCSRLCGLLDQVHVSVDGSTAELHDQFRGEGNFDKTLQGVRFLKEANIEKIGLSPTLIQANIRDLPNVMNLAIRLGVALRTSVFLPVGRGSCNASVFTPSPKQLLNAFRDTHRAILKCSDEEIEPQSRFLGISMNLKAKCGAAHWTISVNGDGAVYPCNALCQPDFVVGNLLQAEDLPSLLAESPITRQFDAIDIDEREGCKDCDVRYFCGGGCVGHSFLVHGDLQARDPFCDLYRYTLRAQIWTVRADASLRENTQAMIDWFNSGDSSAPVEVKWKV